MAVTVRSMSSPVGQLLLVGDGVRLQGLYMADQRGMPVFESVEDGRAFAEPVRQLCEWFDGRRRQFDLTVDPLGTPFQRRVWEALLEIPYGKTATYGEVAARVGQPGSARAVGHAIGRNPVGIVIPCHRVVGAGGLLTGYAGGLDRKASLLAHERATVDATGAPAGRRQPVGAA